jgi:hypothetical protein
LTSNHSEITPKAMPVLKNHKHERFAQELAKGKTADEAYELAGFKANRGNASTLKAKQNISDRVEELLARGAARAEMTVATILDELEEARGLAREIQQPAPMVAASMGKAKVAGLLVEKAQVSGPNGGPIQTEDIAFTELARRIAFALTSAVGGKGEA